MSVALTVDEALPWELSSAAAEIDTATIEACRRRDAVAPGRGTLRRRAR